MYGDIKLNKILEYSLHYVVLHNWRWPEIVVSGIEQVLMASQRWVQRASIAL